MREDEHHWMSVAGRHELHEQSADLDVLQVAPFERRLDEDGDDVGRRLDAAASGVDSISTTGSALRA